MSAKASSKLPKQDTPLVAARRARLREWIEKHYDGIANRFATATGMSQPQVADMLRGGKSGKSFGEKVAAKVEGLAKMPPNYLVRPSDPAHSDTGRMKIWDVHISEEEAQLAAEWGKLDEPFRTEIRERIYLLVAEQKKSPAKRRKSKGPGTKHGDRPLAN